MPEIPSPLSRIAVRVESTAGSDCGGSESFALRVLGDAMAPEFLDGHIIIVEPGGAVTEGAYVVADAAGDTTFRQLAVEGDAWVLRALNPAYPDQVLAQLADVRGIVIQRVVPGRRSLTKSYVD